MITQDTGFGRVLPTGEGLFAVRTWTRPSLAVEAIAADPAGHRRAAAEIAREHFDAERVLGPAAGATSDVRAAAAPQGRRDRRQHRATGLGPSSSVLALIPHFKCEEWLDDCLASLVRQTRPLDGIVVIDDASGDPPVEIVERHPGVTLLHAAENVGPYRLDPAGDRGHRLRRLPVPGRRRLVGARPARALLEGAEQTGAELIGSQEIRIFCDEPEAVPIAWPLDGNAPFARAADRLLAACTRPASSPATWCWPLGGFSPRASLRRRRRVPPAGALDRDCRATSRTTATYRRIRQGSLTTAPATAIGTPVRKQLMEETFARANANAEAVAAGRPPDLSPLRTAPPVELHHVAGPPLRRAGELVAPAVNCGPRRAGRRRPTRAGVRGRRRAVGCERVGLRARASTPPCGCTSTAGRWVNWQGERRRPGSSCWPATPPPSGWPRRTRTSSQATCWGRC